MKKQYKILPFLAGILTTVTVMGCAGTVLALSGKVTFNTAGIVLHGKTVAKAGESLQTEAGASIPSVLCYTDENGGKTHYAPIRTISEQLGLTVGWESANSRVVLKDADRPSYVGTIFNDEIKIADGEVTVNGMQLFSETHVSADPFQKKLDSLQDDGEFITFTVTNQGTQEVLVSVGYTFDESGTAAITPTLPAGQTMRYTIELLKDPAELTIHPYIDVSNREGVTTAMDVTVEAVQFDKAENNTSGTRDF